MEYPIRRSGSFPNGSDRMKLKSLCYKRPPQSCHNFVWLPKLLPTIMKFSLSTFICPLLTQCIGLSDAKGYNSEDVLIRGRRLSYNRLWVYEPLTLVTDHAAIDLDLHAIKQQIALGTNTGYTLAERLYKEGSHSKSTAVITLDDHLDRDLFKDTIVQGFAQVVSENQEPQHVLGRLHADARRGDTTLWITYDINAIQESYVGCQVGANPSPNVNGCFASKGTVSFPELGASLGYTYNVTEDNISDRTIQGFSTNAEKWMGTCEKCPRRDFHKFSRFYGKADYGDEIVMAALYGRNTELSKGNMNLGKYSVKGRAEIAKKAMAFLNIWMWVIHQMEHAIDMCERDCTGSNTKKCLESPAVHEWDTSVAYYTGSRMTTDIDAGSMMFHATEKRCIAFKTCGENGDKAAGAARANQLVFKNFMMGQRQLRHGDCNGARKSKEVIVRQMTVPLVQGTLQYAHKVAHSENYDEQFSADFTAFAFSVIPIVNECNEEDAIAIHHELKASTDSDVDFRAIKNALERNYQCMNITCDDVGGIYDLATGQYEPDAKPCKAFTPPYDSSGPTKETTKIAGISLASIAVFGLVVVTYGRLVKKQDEEAGGKVGIPEELAGSGDFVVDEEKVESLTFM